VLPDWRPALTPQQLRPQPSTMSVRHRGVTHRIQYTPGPDGLDAFLATLQAIGIKVQSASQASRRSRRRRSRRRRSRRRAGAASAAGLGPLSPLVWRLPAAVAAIRLCTAPADRRVCGSGLLVAAAVAAAPLPAQAARGETTLPPPPNPPAPRR
jgi:hypothetical protein